MYRSSDVEVGVRVKVCRVESSAPLPACFVSAQLWCEGEQLSIEARTTHSQAQGGDYHEWLHMQAKLSALPRHTVACFTLWRCAFPGQARALGGATLPLFSDDGLLRSGALSLYLWPGVSADGSPRSSTPWDAALLGDTHGLEARVSSYRRGDLDKVPWLDELAFRALQARREQLRASRRPGVLLLHVELPVFDSPVVFHERQFITALDESQSNQVVVVFDPELSQSNPVDDKINRRARFEDGLSTTADVKLTSQEKALVATIIAYPLTEPLKEEEKTALWRFRHYLKNFERALPKFLLSIDWNVDTHAEHALQLVEEWQPIGVEETLEILAMPTAQLDERIRAFAVEQLAKVGNEELLQYLLQLVQSMRAENGLERKVLCTFLMERASSSVQFASYLLWYMKVEAHAGSDSSDEGPFYAAQIVRLKRHVPDGTREIYSKQELLVSRLKALALHVSENAKTRPDMIAALKRALKLGGKFHDLAKFEAVPHPLNPLVWVRGIEADECHVFKSKTVPLRLAFKRRGEDGLYMVMWKTGDDLRQDQLVVQMIRLMDSIMKRNGNLDLKVSPYSVLATSAEDGMVELVPNSYSVAGVLKEYGNDLQAFFREKAPEPDAPFGIRPAVLDTFTRSCAGYAVITYLLGVGDRHLDNLLITPAGNLFHIDFGYILGEDPKMYPPPMKVTREMVLAMGGEHYGQFRNLCCEAFTMLRRRANLILVLFKLMLNAGIVNAEKFTISSNTDLIKILVKYGLDQTEEEAIQLIQMLLDKSVQALMPQLMEGFHSVAQFWRT